MAETAVDPMPMIGPLFIANCLNWLALGCLFVQLYYYTQQFRSDQFKIRLLVYSLLVLELAQTATTTHQAWYYGVQLWNNPSGLLTFPWSAPTVPIMPGIIAAVAQLFYAWRIWTLSPNNIFKGMVVLIVLVREHLGTVSVQYQLTQWTLTRQLALLQCFTALVASAIFAVYLTPAKLLALHPAFELWIATSFIADVLIAACMLWILYNAKSRTTWSRSSNTIGRLIGITVGTGLAVALCGALALALFSATVGASFQYLPAAYIWGKLYSNSVMVSLNSRQSTAQSSNDAGNSYPLSIHVSSHAFSHVEESEGNTSVATTARSWKTRKPGTASAAVGVHKPGQYTAEPDLYPPNKASEAPST
ncbi:hypothetical protein VTO73DRAFT_12793 [Trametes versicolor]